MRDDDWQKIKQKFHDGKHELDVFMNTVSSLIGEHPHLRKPGSEVVHSYKRRLKNDDHLKAKIERKAGEGKTINEDNLFSEVTDLAGVRILHLFQHDFGKIDEVIRKKVTDGDWFLAERAKAYSWDPETLTFFQSFDLEVKEKPTLYTSVHYLIKPRADSWICCEVQVRTLFEEIWGEVDHQFNYPEVCDDLSCVEQIRVLSKIIGAGSRLLDSIKRVREQNKP